LFMKVFDSNLGKPLAEKHYADDCGLLKNESPYFNFEGIKTSIDFYMMAHFFGWVLKSIYIRNVYICWILSVSWEIIELSLRHWLNNFYECWWDSLFLDVIICNGLGIWIGDIICKYFERNGEIHFLQKAKKNSIFFYLKYFTPNKWVRHDWNPFHSLSRYLSVLWFMCLYHLVDLSNFFLKYLIWIPASHTIMLIRLIIWCGSFFMMGTREYYEYATDTRLIRFGQYVWLAHMTLFVEYAIIFKYSKGLFTEVTPIPVKIFWLSVIVVILTIGAFIVILDLVKVKSKSKKEEKTNILEYPIDIEYVDVGTQS